MKYHVLLMVINIPILGFCMITLMNYLWFNSQHGFNNGNFMDFVQAH